MSRNHKHRSGKLFVKVNKVIIKIYKQVKKHVTIWQ